MIWLTFILMDIHVSAVKGFNMFATYADGSIFKGFIFYPFSITNKTDNWYFETLIFFESLM